jgi:hypothetical protein
MTQECLEAFALDGKESQPIVRHFYERKMQVMGLDQQISKIFILSV